MQAMECESSALASWLTDQSVSCLLLISYPFPSLPWLVGRWRRDLPVVHASQCQPLMRWCSWLWLFSASEVGLISYTSSVDMLSGCAHAHSVEAQTSASPVFLPSGWTCHRLKGPTAPPCLSTFLCFSAQHPLRAPTSIGRKVLTSPWVIGKAQGFLRLTPGLP